MIGYKSEEHREAVKQQVRISRTTHGNTYSIANMFFRRYVLWDHDEAMEDFLDKIGELSHAEKRGDSEKIRELRSQLTLC